MSANVRCAGYAVRSWPYRDGETQTVAIKGLPCGWAGDRYVTAPHRSVAMDARLVDHLAEGCPRCGGQVEPVPSGSES